VNAKIEFFAYGSYPRDMVWRVDLTLVLGACLAAWLLWPSAKRKALALVLFLYNTMKPRVAVLGRFHDGTLRDAKVNNLPASDVVTAIRFDGRLYFANVSYFEDAVLDAVANDAFLAQVRETGERLRARRWFGC
jgi:hypothetical protein